MAFARIFTARFTSRSRDARVWKTVFDEGADVRRSDLKVRKGSIAVDWRARVGFVLSLQGVAADARAQACADRAFWCGWR